MATHQLIQLSDGDVITRYTDFASRHVAARHMDVWPPPDYQMRDAHFPVLYMHDGQNLFERHAGFGGEHWGVREAITRLATEGRIRAPIVVGVWNQAEIRRAEYMPEKAYANGQVAQVFHQWAGSEVPRSNAYLKFLVEDVKPLIDATYCTLPAQTDTFIMGSSMGGLISLYALEEYPHIFGGAACLSTHWPAGEDGLVDYLGAHLPQAGAHKLYFDFGTTTLDWNYEPFQRRMDEYVRAAGYRFGADWLTRKFEGAEHNEAAWRARVHIPLEFLLGV
ncbi:MAG: alpha/beta hydrolase [Anaerolineales bacterium]|nr:alpha/beta hydrolase [Anaerolineales bacterium]